ncbi:MAG TPA: class I SAM-dependent methyltransferase [Bordetella sp.]|nr:class I SAM-dependent methyltransferase [Bordetella sp.]
MNSCTSAAAKFDVSRADEYAEQSRIALAGYDACHDLVACMLAASLGTGGAARILVAGAGGTGQEIIAAARLEPGWAYTAVDPSAPMLQLAMANIAAAGLQARTRTVAGTVDDLPMGPDYDAATLIGVLHHVPDDADKRALLESIAVRLAPGAPFVLACNYRHYTDQPLLLAAWRERWRQQGAAPAEVQAKLDKIRHGAVPPESEAALFALLAEAGFDTPLRFFSSLFWGAWIMRRKP